jgi:hypothetical protein
MEEKRTWLIRTCVCVLSTKDDWWIEFFKRPYCMNEAFFMKILWNLINKSNKLLCKVLLSK